MTFLERVTHHALATPSAVAISRRLIGGGYEFTTWGELSDLSQRFAACLSSANGHYVPILSNKSAENVAAIVGALAAGKAFVSLNPKLRMPQITGALSATSASHAVVDADSLRLIAAGVNEASIAATEWLVIGDPTRCERDLDRLRKAGVSFHIFTECVPSSAYQAQRPERPAPACCLFTSGSTGDPKGVLISHEDLVARAEAEQDWFSLERSDTALSLLPFSFDVGLTQLLGALWAGCEITLIASWLPADISAAIRERNVTGIWAVPAIWQDFLKSRVAQHEGIESLRFITVSGGSLPEAQLESLAEMFPNVGIYKTYGQTEDFRSTSLLPKDLFRKPGSVGKAYLGVDLAIVDPEGRRCPPGVVGEVVHSGLGTMLGYLGGNGDGDKLRRLPGSNELSVFTGDLGYLDDDGYLYLQGRRDSMAKVAGNRVFPAEIANQIARFPEIAEVQVVIVQDTQGDATIHAYLVGRPGYSIDTAALRARLRNALPTYMQPQHLTTVRTIPRTATGKPDLVTLASWANEKLTASTS